MNKKKSSLSRTKINSSGFRTVGNVDQYSTKRVLFSSLVVNKA